MSQSVEQSNQSPDNKQTQTDPTKNPENLHMEANDNHQPRASAHVGCMVWLDWIASHGPPIDPLRSLAQIRRVGPSLPFRGVPVTTQNAPLRTAEYGSKLSMESDPKRLRQLGLFTNNAFQTCLAYSIAASSDATAAVATSNGGQGFAVEANAVEARPSSSATSIVFMSSRI